MSTVSETQREQLSAYLDGMLPEAERRQLEQLLQSDAALAAELRDLQTTAALLRDLPPVRPPRSFTLDPATVAPRRRTFGFAWTRWAAVVGALALFLTVGLSTLTRGSSAPNSAPLQSSAGNAVPAADEPAPTMAALSESAAEDSAGGAMPAQPMQAQAAATEAPAAAEALIAPATGAAPPEMGMATISGTIAPPAGGAPMDTQRSAITMTYGAIATGDQAAGAALDQSYPKILTDAAGLASQAPVGIIAPDLDNTDTSSPDTRDFVSPPPSVDLDANAVQPAGAADEAPNLGLLFGLLALAGVLGALALTVAIRRVDRRD